jgi:hypothetical protein
MSFLRRLLGGSNEGGTETNGATPHVAANDVDAAEAERLHERELLLSENERLDELRLRQLRYADRAWTPPAQGGERRSDDADRGAGK